MKLSVMADNLAPALAIAARAVSKRSTLPVLSNVRVGTEDGYLTLDTTDLVIWMHVRVPAKTEPNGEGPEATTVSAKDLLAIAKLASREEVSRLDLTVETVGSKERMTLITGDGKRTLPTIEAEEYPAFRVPGKPIAVTLAANDLRRALVESVVAVARDEARPILTGVFMKLASSAAGGRAEFVAADNYRLALTSAPLLDRPHKGRVLVPEELRAVLRAEFVDELIRILPKTDDPIEIQLEYAKSLIAVTVNVVTGRATSEVTLVGSLIDGQYPNYQSVIPIRSMRSSVTIPRQRFLDALKSAATVQTNSVRLTFDSAGLTVFATDSEQKTFETTISAPYAGLTVAVKADPRYLRTVEAIEDEEIVIWVGGDLAPLIIDARGRDDFSAVVMPVR